MIKKILVVNRGDIVVRIIRICKELGIKIVVIYFEIDKDCFYRYIVDEFICIGLNNISKSYNNIENIIYFVFKLKCDVIYLGFGFLLENFEFVK